jgi:hypothetical protein
MADEYKSTIEEVFAYFKEVPKDDAEKNERKEVLEHFKAELYEYVSKSANEAEAWDVLEVVAGATYYPWFWRMQKEFNEKGKKIVDGRFTLAVKDGKIEWTNEDDQLYDEEDIAYDIDGNEV